VIVLTTLIAIVAIGTGFAAHSVAGLYIFGILGACSAWSLSTLMPGLIKDVSAPGEEGRTLALTHMVWSTAMLTGSLLGGWLVAVDATIPFLVTGTLNIAAILFAVMLWRLGQRVAS
jgi:MFS family permease